MATNGNNNWRLDAEHFFGYIENEMENNRMVHEEMKDTLKGIKECLDTKFNELPCEDHGRKIGLFFNKYFILGFVTFYFSSLALIFFKASYVIEKMKNVFS